MNNLDWQRIRITIIHHYRLTNTKKSCRTSFPSDQSICTCDMVVFMLWSYHGHRSPHTAQGKTIMTLRNIHRGAALFWTFNHEKVLNISISKETKRNRASLNLFLWPRLCSVLCTTIYYNQIQFWDLNQISIRLYSSSFQTLQWHYWWESERYFK